jgi:hypothetical protein
MNPRGQLAPDDQIAIDFDFKIEFAHYANSDFDRIQLVSVISGGQAEGAANRAAKT